VNVLLNNNLEYLRTLVQEEDITNHMETLNKESEMQFMFEMSKKLSVIRETESLLSADKN